MLRRRLLSARIPRHAGGANATRVSFAAILLCGLGGVNAALAADAESAAEKSLSSLSIEELMDIPVTSVSKRPEKLMDAPAAIQVVTGEDIRRSGMTSIPDALRLAGNLDVSKKNANEWVISARGFNSDVGNKLLVLMDGRTLYTPLFSGVFWARQDYVLEDIARIEVVSGPGGALWGANAVNGVINITTKSAKETQGLYVEAGGGTKPEGFGTVRYGAEIGADVFFRLYGKYTQRPDEVFANGRNAHDGWNMLQGGFRVDVHPKSENNFTLQGDLYRTGAGITTGGRSKVVGGNLLGRWNHIFSDTSDMSFQVYYDRTDLTLPTPPFIFAPAGVFKDTLDTVDLDAQHRIRIGSHHIVWGLGYRFMHDVVQSSPALAILPGRQNQSLYSAFVQDEYAIRDNLVLTLGTKVEHTHYTGWEVEPSARLQWSLSDQHSLWAAVSRAVRTPSRLDREISQPAPGYVIVILQGRPGFKSEELLAYELGYRGQWSNAVGGGISVFYNQYDHVRSTTTSPLGPPFNLPFPFYFENNLEGDTYGAEINASLQLRDWWRLHASFRAMGEKIHVKPGRVDFNHALNETNDAKQQFTIRSSMNLPHDLSFDTTLRWVSKRTMNNAGVATKVPPYAELDLRLAWDLPGPVEFAVVGTNLLHERHPEFGAPGPTQVQVRRAVYGKVVYRMGE